MYLLYFENPLYTIFHIVPPRSMQFMIIKTEEKYIFASIQKILKFSGCNSFHFIFIINWVPKMDFFPFCKEISIFCIRSVTASSNFVRICDQRILKNCICVLEKWIWKVHLEETVNKKITSRYILMEIWLLAWYSGLAKNLRVTKLNLFPSIFTELQFFFYFFFATHI